MLSVQNLEVVYQDVILVLRGISFDVPKGKIVSLLGSNGSGKTTAIRSITVYWIYKMETLQKDK